jgi:hypothetical protein
MAVTFSHFGCTPLDDLMEGSFFLVKGSCADLASLGLQLPLGDFNVQVINHQAYGTLFETLTPGPGTVSARIVQLKNPPAGSCGEFTLNVEVAGIDTATYGLTGGNPFALIIQDDLDTGCFDINNAVVGNQIPQPAVPVVRRGARRGARR